MAANTYKSRAALAVNNDFISVCGVALGLVAEGIVNGTNRVSADNLTLAHNVLRDTASYERRMARMIAYNVTITIGGLYNDAAPVMPSDIDVEYGVSTLFNLL